MSAIGWTMEGSGVSAPAWRQRAQANYAGGKSRPLGSEILPKSLRFLHPPIPAVP
jgi:hypothetical protein